VIANNKKHSITHCWLFIAIARTVLITHNFAVTGPLVWNSWPANLCPASIFRRLSLRELPWAQLRTLCFLP